MIKIMCLLRHIILHEHLFLFLVDLYWSIIASQYCVNFFFTTKRISHMHTHVPISPPSWASLPSSLSQPSRSLQRAEPISLYYAAASHQPIDRWMDKEDVAHIYNGILAIKRKEIELFVVRWMDLESVIQSEVSQKEKNKFRMLTHIFGI